MLKTISVIKETAASLSVSRLLGDILKGGLHVLINYTDTKAFVGFSALICHPTIADSSSQGGGQGLGERLVHLLFFFNTCLV
jgi:hypothetical protein